MARKVENKHWFDFQYEVVNRNADYAIIHMGAATVSLSDRELGLVAEALQRHGGLDVGLHDIPWLDERVLDAAIFDFQSSVDDTSIDYDTISVEPADRLPDELMAEVRQSVGIDLQCNFYYLEEGIEQSRSCQMRISPDVFDAMVDTVKRAHTEGTDFDNLKADHPEAYAHSGERVLQFADNLCVSAYGHTMNIYLKEFPYQVYEAVTL